MQHMTRHTNTHTHTCNSYCVLQHTHIAHTTRFRMQECNPERERERERERDKSRPKVCIDRHHL